VYPQETQGHPVVVFVHGGAWGWNGKENHHLIGKYLQSIGFVSILPNYSRHPYGHVEEMIDDLDQAFEWCFKNAQNYGGDVNKVIFVGHSAGSHLISMTVLEKIRRLNGHTLFLETVPTHTSWNTNQIRKIILFSGVFDISEHYKYESWRAVEDISPMARAMRGQTFFPQYSPTTVLQHCSRIQDSELIASLRENFPETDIIHAEEDFTVPCSSSEKFYEQLKELEVPGINFKLINGITHSGIAFGLMGCAEGNHIMQFITPWSK